jgi:transcriptional regulator with XRE-family HTH domain
MADMTEEEITRVAGALKTAVRLSGVSHRRIEREMGLCPGYLSRIFGGRVELRVRHVLGVCGVIGLPVDSFFHAVFPRRKEADEAAQRVERGLLELHPAPYSIRTEPVASPVVPAGPAPAPWAKADRLMERLRQVLEEVEENGAQETGT